MPPDLAGIAKCDLVRLFLKVFGDETSQTYRKGSRKRLFALAADFCGALNSPYVLICARSLRRPSRLTGNGC